MEARQFNQATRQRRAPLLDDYQSRPDERKSILNAVLKLCADDDVIGAGSVVDAESGGAAIVGDQVGE